MGFSKDHHWVWDFWTADDGERYHLYYLHAPTSLGDPDLRHRNARIGHATSLDLTEWTDHGTVLEPGMTGDIDESSTWTGSVVRADDGAWRMFYTGSTFLSPTEITNIETVGVAHSDDLSEWSKESAFRLSADSRWYEVLDQRSWHEEAWRDPWVFRDGDGSDWHMLITARIPGRASDRDRGVIAHATSANLDEWTVGPPLSAPGSGFAHLEVPQTVRFGDRDWLLFSCDSSHLAGERAGETGGIWIAPAESSAGPYDTASAELLLDERYYSGRIVVDRDGGSRLLAFENAGTHGGFQGRITDPFDVSWDGTRPRVRIDGAEREAS